MIVTMTCPACGTDFERRHDRPGCCSRTCKASLRSGAANANWRGGKTEHELHGVYSELLNRTTNPRHKRWADYGGRGITVCDRWREDFWAFVADVGQRPPGRGPSGRALWSLDRIDNDGNYEPGNVRWATDSEQRRNQRRSTDSTKAA